MLSDGERDWAVVTGFEVAHAQLLPLANSSGHMDGRVGWQRLSAQAGFPAGLSATSFEARAPPPG